MCLLGAFWEPGSLHKLSYLTVKTTVCRSAGFRPQAHDSRNLHCPLNPLLLP